MPSMAYRLVVVYAGHGFRWPFRHGDGIEVWTADDTTLLGVVPQGVVMALLAHAIQASALQVEVKAALALPPPPLTPPRKPPAASPRLRGSAGRRLRGLGLAAVIGLVLLEPARVSAQSGWILWQYAQAGPSQQWWIVTATPDQPACQETRARTFRARTPQQWGDVFEGLMPGKVSQTIPTPRGLRFVTSRGEYAAVEFLCLPAGVQPQ